MSTEALSTHRFAYHVIPVGKMWKVTIPGDSVPLSLHARKEDALSRALEYARREGGLDVLVFGPDGSLETEFTTQARP